MCEEQAHLPAGCFGKSCAEHLDQNQGVPEQDNRGFRLRWTDIEAHIVIQLVTTPTVFLICD